MKAPFQAPDPSRLLVMYPFLLLSCPVRCPVQAHTLPQDLKPAPLVGLGAPASPPDRILRLRWGHCPPWRRKVPDNDDRAEGGDRPCLTGAGFET